MPFPRCKARVVGRAVVPIAYCETGPTTQRKSAVFCVRVTSRLLAMRNTENGSGLGRWRWVIERTFAWLNQFRRLRLRYEKRADMHKALLSLACVLICWNFLQRHFP
jgi:transposase